MRGNRVDKRKVNSKQVKKRGVSPLKFLFYPMSGNLVFVESKAFNTSKCGFWQT